MNSTLKLSNVAGYFDSRLVQIVAGSDKRTFYIHATALSASGSPSLQALVSEKWDAEKDKVIDWTHTDSATISRFVTYLYTNDYVIPDPELRHEVLSEVSQPSNGDGDGTAAEDEIGIPKARRPIPESNVEENDDDYFPTLRAAFSKAYMSRPLTPLKDYMTAESNSDTQRHHTLDNVTFPYDQYTYTPPMLALARLYCFASYHLCQSLQTSTTQRMIDILTKVDCSQPDAVRELAEVIQEVYNNTTGVSETVGSMRDVLSHFAAINYTTLMHHQFEDLCVQGGDFILDLAQKIRRRLLAAGCVEQGLRDELESLKKETNLPKSRMSCTVCGLSQLGCLNCRGGRGSQLRGWM